VPDAASVLPFAGWESFYVIAGSSAAALTGLNFVVIALGTETQRSMPPDAVRAFTTPTIVHFCIVLLISAVLSAPWTLVHGPAVCLAVCGIGGLAYSLFITWQAGHQKDYKPVFEDWLFHSLLPIAAYVGLLVTSVLLPRHLGVGSFVIAGVSLALLFIGIHNAWDTVIWMAVTGANRKTESSESADGSGAAAPSVSTPAASAAAKQGSPVG
jgi:hypothetical protein